MKIAPQIEALERLAALDAELLALDGVIGQEREALEKQKGQLQKLDEKIAGANASIAEMEKTRNELHAEARQMSAQMERSREKLARCRTEREVNAAQREVEELRKLYRDREVEVEKLSALVDQARAEADVTQKERDGIASQLGSTEGDVTTKLGQLEAEATGKRKTRGALIEKVQPVLFRRYETVRKRRGSAIAHTDADGTCSECHMRIPPMQFQKMMRGDDFDQCPSCARIIYHRPPELGSAESPTGGP
ncbi:MAG TPA: C4-type zinc ribbon domain-containing protein [Polyangiaceae bacterium]|nr:C4-type zinc ribbon domain-containing protein [Polyangiaceae bacterium]